MGLGLGVFTVHEVHVRLKVAVGLVHYFFVVVVDVVLDFKVEVFLNGVVVFLKHLDLSRIH